MKYSALVAALLALALVACGEKAAETSAPAAEVAAPAPAAAPVADTPATAQPAAPAAETAPAAADAMKK